MSTLINEEEPPDEYGGRLQDTEDRKVAVFFGTGHFTFGQASAGGRMEGPATLAPLVLMLSAIICGGIIWAASSWQPGAAVMVGSLVVNLIFIRSNRSGIGGPT